jgi:hypothetical protein
MIEEKITLEHNDGVCGVIFTKKKETWFRLVLIYIIFGFKIKTDDKTYWVVEEVTDYKNDTYTIRRGDIKVTMEHYINKGYKNVDDDDVYYLQREDVKCGFHVIEKEKDIVKLSYNGEMRDFLMTTTEAREHYKFLIKQGYKKV